jgi:putative ABC transport system ATP-binding protein
MSTAIATQHIYKTYGKGEAAFTALDDVNIVINAGESVAIVGKSGSGKSTLMHTLALLDRPTRGSVLVSDEDAAHLSGRQLDLMRNKNYGFVFQQFFLNGNDTVLNNVVLPLKIGNIRRKERKERGLQALKSVGLADKASNKASDLSGGQKQRVCIARALISNPSVIFADEPTGNLDSHTGKAVEDLLFSLNKEHGITLIIVTHDSELAARCDGQLHIKDGKLVGRSDV